MRYPRTLVLSPCTFNYENGGGVTFSNLFRGFPPDHLANLHSSDQRSDSSVCRNFYRLSNREIVRPWPFRLKGQPTLGSSPTEGGARGTWKARLAGNSGMPQHFHMTPELNRWLEDFKPEVIYTILGPIPHLEAILAIRQKFGAKLVIHCMDDWHNQAYTTGIFRYQRRKMVRLLREIVATADHCLAIGLTMAKDLSARYQRPFLPFQNTIDVEAFARQIASLKPAPPAPADKKELLYYGSVFPFAQLSSITFVARALTGSDWRLVVRTSRECLPYLADLANTGDSVRLETMEPSPEDFPRCLASADALLLPANFDPQSVEFLRLSMPTKIPGYMVSGTPVLYFGPANIAQGEYVANGGWGFCVNAESGETIRAALEKIAANDPAVAQTLSRAKSLAQKNHDERFVRASFQELLCRLN